MFGTGVGRDKKVSGKKAVRKRSDYHFPPSPFVHSCVELEEPGRNLELFYFLRHALIKASDFNLG